MFFYRYILLCFTLLIATKVPAQQQAADDKMEWFADAKLGVFIHWGIYSVQGISESWSFFNNYISHQDYMKQLDGFGAEKYDPTEWVDLIKGAGAKYAVMTSKHHDGVSLWNTEAKNAITTHTHAAAKRDLLTPFIHALKDAKLKTGLYFSLPDWSHPYYDIKTRTQTRYALETDPKRWMNFVAYYQQQLEELSIQYQPDLLWFDGDWEHTAEEWRSSETAALLKYHNPNIIINSRLNQYGDYDTPEQGVPITSPAHAYWELCYTMNDSWGYQPFDQNYKSPNMIVRTLVDCIAMGGNLLLDIGPRADGSVPDPQVAVLRELGRWTEKHAEAVYGTRAGWENMFVDAKGAFSKDRKTVYVYLDRIVDSFETNVFVQAPIRIRVVGGTELDRVDFFDTQLKVDLTSVEFDPTVTVLAIEFDTIPTRGAYGDLIDSSLASIGTLMNQAHHTSIIEEIVERTAKGDYLFKHILSDDGERLDLVEPNEKAARWVRKHSEVLHNPSEGIVSGHFDGYTALSEDRQTLYLFVKGRPTGPIAIKGLKNNIARIRIVGEGSMLSHQLFNKLYWSAVPGIVYIDIPEDRLDADLTVIAVLLDDPIALFREEINVLDNNL